MSKRNASSQAAWALLIEGVASARVEAHRLKHLINRATSLVESSEAKEHIHQVAGDLLLSAPTRLDHLERHLDRTALALAKMGEEFLDSRLPLSDKTEVDEAVQSAFGGGKMRTSVERLTDRWVQAAGKVTPWHKAEFARRAKIRGLDGNVRFSSIGQALTVLHEILGGMSMELASITSADLFRDGAGRRVFDLAFQTEDPFGPNPISNSRVVFTWYYFEERDNYEIVVHFT